MQRVVNRAVVWTVALLLAVNPALAQQFGSGYYTSEGCCSSGTSAYDGTGEVWSSGDTWSTGDCGDCNGITWGGCAVTSDCCSAPLAPHALPTPPTKGVPTPAMPQVPRNSARPNTMPAPPNGAELPPRTFAPERAVPPAAKAPTMKSRAAQPPVAEPPLAEPATEPPMADFPDLNDTNPPAKSPAEPPAASPDENKSPEPPAADQKKDELEDLFNDKPAAPAGGSSRYTPDGADPLASVLPNVDLVEPATQELPTPKQNIAVSHTVHRATEPLRLWTDNTGGYQVTARLVEIQDGKVRLQKESGKFTTVPLARLSQADADFVVQRANVERSASVEAGRKF